MTSRFFVLLCAAGLVLSPALAFAVPDKGNTFNAEQRARADQLQSILATQHPQTGVVKLEAARVTLNLGKAYYFLNAQEARKVIVDGWRNPPEVADGVLGLVFPAGKTFLDDTWGAVVTYQDTGYVSDGDAKETDYSELLSQMQEGEDESNQQRTQQGYPTMNLIGWAEQPSYDSRSHSMVWAQNLKVGGDPVNTLNYDVRLLGRQGVLSLNMLSSMPHLQEIRGAAKTLVQTASFDSGARYADFNKETDKVAEYGVGGLVAAGLGLAAAKKLGFLAIILGLGKKLIFVLIAGLALFKGFIGRLFGRGKDDGAEA